MHRRLAPWPRARHIGRGAVCVAGLVLQGLQSLAFAQFGAGEPTTPNGRTEKLVYPQVTREPQSREYQPIPIEDSESAKAIRAALSEPRTTEKFNFNENSLQQLQLVINETYKIKVLFDQPAMQDFDLAAPEVTGDFSNMPLRSALRRILKPRECTYTVVDDVLLITTEQQAEEDLVLVAYPLPWGSRDAANHVVEVQPLIDLIQAICRPNSWDTVGGTGIIREVLLGGEGMLLVFQTFEIHEEIEVLLRRLHERSFADFDGGHSVLRVHHVDDAMQRAEFEASLKNICNAALSVQADEHAKVSVLGESVVILSQSAEFHGMASQVIAAVTGIRHIEPMSRTSGIAGLSPGGMGGMSLSHQPAQTPLWQPPPMVGSPATQTPSTAQTPPFDPAAIEKSLQVAYAAIRNGDFDAASAVIDSVVAGADPALRARLDRWKRFTACAKGYSELRAKAYRAAVSSEFEIGDRVIIIVEIDEEQLIFRDSGKQMKVRLDELPTEIDRAIVEQWVGRDGRAANHLFLGASHLARDRPSPDDALREWRCAASAGESDGMLMLYPLIMDSVIVAVEAASVASQ
jgi:hypothetical protein